MRQVNGEHLTGMPADKDFIKIVHQRIQKFAFSAFVPNPVLFCIIRRFNRGNVPGFFKQGIGKSGRLLSGHDFQILKVKKV
jgi:hypothetical protein